MRAVQVRCVKSLWALLAVALIYSAVAYADPIVISPAQAALHVGQYVTVKGKVVVVYTAPSDVIYLNFGAEYPKQVFSVVILADYANQFPKVHELEGRIVKVSGVIKLHEDKPEIIVQRTYQLQQ